MKKYLVISLFIILLFNGCSKKDINTPNETTKSSIQKASNNSKLSTSQFNEDSDLSSFEDEFEVKKESDPLRGYNRVMTNFNDGVYHYFFLPVSNGYKQITNNAVRESVGNFFSNLLFPVRFVNNILQGKIENAGEELGRFLINSTLGFVGFFDPATSEFNLQEHPEDFGQTLGYWGFGAGPHIVLPFFGPSNVRDILGKYPDSLLNPVDYYEQRDYNLLNNNFESFATKTYDKINDTALQDRYGILKKDAIDLYPYLKKSYEQYRLQQIKE